VYSKILLEVLSSAEKKEKKVGVLLENGKLFFRNDSLFGHAQVAINFLNTGFTILGIGMEMRRVVFPRRVGDPTSVRPQPDPDPTTLSLKFLSSLR